LYLLHGIPVVGTFATTKTQYKRQIRIPTTVKPLTKEVYRSTGLLITVQGYAVQPLQSPIEARKVEWSGEW
jgi:hypothetical protein